MSDNEEEEVDVRAALNAVSKKFEAKIPRMVSDITVIRKNLESLFAEKSMDTNAIKEEVSELLRRSHTLAGSAGQFGHPGLTELARAVEEMCLSITEANFENLDAFPLLFQFTIDVESYKF